MHVAHNTPTNVHAGQSRDYVGRHAVEEKEQPTLTEASLGGQTPLKGADKVIPTPFLFLHDSFMRYRLFLG